MDHTSLRVLVLIYPIVYQIYGFSVPFGMKYHTDVIHEYPLPQPPKPLDRQRWI